MFYDHSIGNYHCYNCNYIIRYNNTSNDNLISKEELIDSFINLIEDCIQNKGIDDNYRQLIKLNLLKLLNLL
jgi:hypothetical protein